MDQVIPTLPRFLSKPKPSQTAVLDPSTILFLHGGWPACSASHPFRVTLFHHFSRHTLPIASRNPYHLPTPRPMAIPPSQ